MLLVTRPCNFQLNFANTGKCGHVNRVSPRKKQVCVVSDQLLEVKIRNGQDIKQSESKCSPRNTMMIVMDNEYHK